MTRRWFAVGTTLLACLLVVCCGTPQEEEHSPQLSIRRVELCSDINTENGEYTVQLDATFDHGDTVWLYFEVLGFTIKGVQGKFECWTKFSDLKLYGPGGDRMAHLMNIAEAHETALDEPPNFAWFYCWYTSEVDDVAGRYRFEFTVEDKLSDATGTGSATFTLK